MNKCGIVQFIPRKSLITENANCTCRKRKQLSFGMIFVRIVNGSLHNFWSFLPLLILLLVALSHEKTPSAKALGVFYRPSGRSFSNFNLAFSTILRVIPSQCTHWRGNLKDSGCFFRLPHQSADWFAMTIWLAVQRSDLRCKSRGRTQESPYGVDR